MDTKVIVDIPGGEVIGWTLSVYNTLTGTREWALVLEKNHSCNERDRLRTSDCWVKCHLIWPAPAQMGGGGLKCIRMSRRYHDCYLRQLKIRASFSCVSIIIKITICPRSTANHSNGCISMLLPSCLALLYGLITWKQNSCPIFVCELAVSRAW